MSYKIDKMVIAYSFYKQNEEYNLAALKHDWLFWYQYWQIFFKNSLVYISNQTSIIDNDRRIKSGGESLYISII